MDDETCEDSALTIGFEATLVTGVDWPDEDNDNLWFKGFEGFKGRGMSCCGKIGFDATWLTGTWGGFNALNEFERQ